VSFRTAIFNNVGLKVAALIVGVVLWLFAKGEQEADRLFPLPLVLRNMPDGLTAVEQVPDRVEVVLAGDNKELVRLSIWGDPYAVIDMSDAEADQTFRVSLSSANIVLPRDAEVQVVEVRNPRNLDLEIDRLVDRKVRVAPAVQGVPADGFFFVGEKTALPDTVFVFGPERVVTEIDSVVTALLDVTGRRSRVDAARRIEFDGEWNLHAVPKEVRVVVDIEGTRVTTLSGVPAVFEHEPGFANATVEPGVLELTLSGPDHLVVSLTAEDIEVVVDAMGLPRGTHDLVPIVRTPEGIDVHGVTPPRVTVNLR
jgi:YbbR domain-containing protein